MEKKNNVFGILILCAIVLAVGIFIGKDMNSDSSSKKNNQTNKETNEKNKKDTNKKSTKTKKEDTEDITVLDKTVGEWGICYGEYQCNELVIGKDGKDYTYIVFPMWSEAGGVGKVTKFRVVEKNNYKLTVHYEEDDNDLVYTPEQTIEVPLDVTDIGKGYIELNGERYKKVVGDTEEFFMSLFK